MLLNDIGRVPSTTLRKINQHLESNYGFKITEAAQDHDLVAIMETIQDEITDLKIKGDDAKGSPEISKRLLVLEGLKTLREFAMIQFQSPKLETVIKGMTDFVIDTFHHAGTSMADFDEAMKDAMKVYRSSKYRFPDDYIEQRVRSAAMASLGSADDVAPSMAPMMEDADADVDEEQDNAQGDAEMKGLDEDAEGRQDRHADNEWQLDTKDKYDTAARDQVPMVRNPHTGQMQPDPFAAKAAAKKKEIAMRENKNLVKNLRRLLETEVSQAEVMMAAKKFAEELQEMVEKIGRLQNEDLPPVTDQMRETYGMESASSFQTQIYGSFQGVMDSLYTAKSQVDDAVANLATTGQVSAAVDMDKSIEGGMGMDSAGGMDGDMGMDDADMGDAELDLDNIGDELGGEDEFGGAEGEEPLGRAMKTEAALQRKVMEMQRLVNKARKLKESKRR
jgi:hypothetical protein